MLRARYPLETARLRLRPFEAGDLVELSAFHSLPEVARAMLEDEWRAWPRAGGPRSKDAVSGGRPG